MARFGRLPPREALLRRGALLRQGRCWNKGAGHGGGRGARGCRRGCHDREFYRGSGDRLRGPRGRLPGQEHVGGGPRPGDPPPLRPGRRRGQQPRPDAWGAASAGAAFRARATAPHTLRPVRGRGERAGRPVVRPEADRKRRPRHAGCHHGGGRGREPRVILGDMYSSTDNKMLLIRRVAARLSRSTTETDSLSDVLDKAKQNVLDKALKRLKRIAQEAQSRRVKVLVDAEYTYLNPGLSLLALAAVSLYNKDTALFWNTYQCYLKDTRQKLEQELALVSGDMGVHFGAKIVRGAYMEQERRRAQRLRMPDPVCPDYAATGRNFDTVVSFLLEKVAVPQSRCELIVASHNEQSIRFAIHKMDELKIGRTDGVVSFGQLFGMSDQLTYPLANCGYCVYKSVPYGTMEEVLPYLARRAAENKSVLQGARKEQTLLALELKMRFLRRFGILKTAGR